MKLGCNWQSELKVAFADGPNFKFDMSFCFCDTWANEISFVLLRGILTFLYMHLVAFSNLLRFYCPVYLNLSFELVNHTVVKKTID